jgi:hypothetical protein
VPVLTFLAWLWFGGDVTALGSPDYPTRRDAHRRLGAAGWPAYPALLTGGPNAESADRCSQLIERLPGAWDVLGRQCDRVAAGFLRSPDPAPELTPACWLLLEGAVCRAAEASAPVPVFTADGQCRGEVRPGRCLWWVRSPQFVAGTHDAEIRLLCESVRQHRQK